MKTQLSTIARVASACLVAGAVLSSVAPAYAGGTLDADLNLGTHAGTGDVVLGVAGRAGWRFDLGPVWIQPEAGGEYVAFPSGTFDMPTGHVARVLGGVRIGATERIGDVIEPSLFGHGGVGWVLSSLYGPAADVGVALDVRLVRSFRFGVQGAYNVVAPPRYFLSTEGPAVQWMTFGAHVGMSF